MIKTLAGPNTFLLRQQLRDLIHEFIEEHGEHELERIEVEETSDIKHIRTQLESLPFLSAKRMLVLEQPSRSKSFRDDIEAIVAGIAQSTDVVLVEPALDKRTSYARFVQKQTDFRAFSDLDEPALIDWLVAAASKAGGSLSKKDARFLVQRIGSNQFMLHNELEKLLSYNKNISEQTITELTEPTPQSSIFGLIDAVFSGNSKAALNLYEDQRAQQVEPQKILYMIARQMHIIALLAFAPKEMDSNAIAKETGLHPFAVRQAQSSARRLSKQAIKQAVSELRQLDEQQKTSSTDIDEGLRTFIVLLAHE